MTITNQVMTNPSDSAHANDLPSVVYYCRVGRHGQIGRFRDPTRALHRRGEEVVLRTARGIEAGKILSSVSRAPTPSDDLPSSLDGRILRRLSHEDRLFLEQLELAAKQALNECQAILKASHASDCLLDVEPLMDGKTLYFHFVGSPSSGLNAILQSLAQVFHECVQQSRFAQLLEVGCGPGCGSEEKSGCDTEGGCSVCVIAQSCRRSDSLA